MTYLYPLNNYPLFCQYSLSFESENVEAKDYRAFKKLLENHESTSLIKHPIIPTFNTQCLTQDPQSLNLDFAGIPLESGPSHEKLYLVPDHIDLLTLGFILRESRHESYIYESAYHYWCHKSFFDSHTITQPIVFLNLDGWELKTLIPLTLEYYAATQRRIPILKPQAPIEIEDPIDLKSCHDRIHTAIAQEILKQNFPDLSTHNHTLKHLSDYLRRINITHYIQNQESIIDIIIEISPESQKIYYKSIILDIHTILEIAIKNMPLLELTKLKKKYPDITFIGISQYSILTDFHPISQNIHTLKTQPNLFVNIWQEKQSQDFPLFGIQLDQIQFGIAGQDYGIDIDWIKLDSEEGIISYEGKSQDIIGKIPSSGKEEFKISKDGSNNKISMPIQVNQHDYGKQFEITVHNFDHQHDVWVQICFILTPGKLPKLSVRDTQNHYRITSQLGDKDPLQALKAQSISYLPLKEIYEIRQKDAINQAERLNISPTAVATQVNILNSLIHENTSDIDLDKLADAVKSLSYLFKKKSVTRYRRPNMDPLQYIDPEKLSLEHRAKLNTIRIALQKLNANNLQQILFSDGFYNDSAKLNIIREYLVFIGKLYFLSDSVNTGTFLVTHGMKLLDELAKSIHQGLVKSIYGVYFSSLARMSFRSSIQDYYMSLFNRCHNSELYSDGYLWGYGRILKWYFNYDSVNKDMFAVHNHQLLEGLVDSHFKYHLQNTFLSLIYLLTYRNRDNQFCGKNSNDIILAQRVVDKFFYKGFKLYQVSETQTLPSIYQDFIKGTASQQIVLNLLQVQ